VIDGKGKDRSLGALQKKERECGACGPRVQDVGKCKQEKGQYWPRDAFSTEFEGWMLGINVALHHLRRFKMCIAVGEV